MNVFHRRILLSAMTAIVVYSAACCGPASAQFGGGGMGGMGMGGMGGGMGGMGGGMGGGLGGGGQGGAGGGAGGGGAGGTAGGIFVDAQGVLHTTMVADPNLGRTRRAAVASLDGDLQSRTPLRHVALSRLERELAKAVTAGHGIPDEMQKLAGLTRVRYVFIYPGEGSDPGEVVIAGPAEPWMADAAGRTVGAETGAPTILLEDLAAALRSSPPGQAFSRTLGCSIDPTQEGLAALQDFMRRIGRVNPKADMASLVTGMRQALGLQTVRVDGVSPATHFAQVMVEADYRMKLIGIGLERSPVKMSTWVELAKSQPVAANALQRWYFVPNYQCVRVSEDDLAIELVGDGVKLVGADEVVLPDGRRMSADRANNASKLFTTAFTKKYPEIAARSPVYAQLRSLIDLAVVAAWLQEFDGFGKAGWAANTLRNESAYPIETFPPVVQVETAINAIWSGSRLITPIGGGVTIQPRMAIDSPNLLVDENGDVGQAHAAVKLPADRWWW